MLNTCCVAHCNCKTQLINQKTKNNLQRLLLTNSSKIKLILRDLSGEKTNPQRSCKPKPNFRLKKISKPADEKNVFQATVLTLKCYSLSNHINKISKL